MATQFGKVFLIGAGPGATDLITVRGARILATAQVVLHDALVTDEMLSLCPNAKKIAVGKRSGKCSTEQSMINQLLVDCAREYAIVVRLKGGDPMLFGRADEELSILEQNNIEVEVVPGITTAFAAAAASKQPLTQRGIARSVAFFTTSNASDQPPQNTLPNCDTLVQYMGGHEAKKTAQDLIQRGLAQTTPVLVVENCSYTNQIILRITLNELAQGLNDFNGPVLIIIGKAMQSRDNRPDTL